MDEVQSSHGTARKQQIVLMQVTLDSFDHRVSEGQQLRQDRATDRDRNFSQSGGNAPKGRTFTLPYHFVEPPNWSRNPLTMKKMKNRNRKMTMISMPISLSLSAI